MDEVQSLDLCSIIIYTRQTSRSILTSIMLIVYIIILLFTIVWHHFRSFAVGIWFVIFFFQVISNNLFFPLFIVCICCWRLNSLCVLLLIFVLSFVHAFHKHWAFDLHLFNFQIKWCRQSLFRWLLLLMLLLLHFTLEKKFWSCFFLFYDSFHINLNCVCVCLCLSALNSDETENWKKHA